MKKFLYVCCVLVLTLALMQSNLSAWTGTGHEDLIRKGVSSSGASLTANQLSIMITSAKLADSDVKPASSTASADSYLAGNILLHAAGDTKSYVNNTKFLYEVALEFRKGNDNALNTVSARWQGYLNNKQITNFELEPMKKSVNRVISSSLFKYYPEAAKANTPGYKSWKVLGLAHHLTGDAYAHRTVLPSSSVSGTLGVYSTATKVGTSHFNMKLTSCSYNGKAITDTNLKEALVVSSKMSLSDAVIDSDKNSSASVKESLKIVKRASQQFNFACVKRAVDLQIMETRDIGRFDKDGVAANHFEDNSAFLATRYSLSAKYASKRLMASFMANSGFSTYTFAQYEGGESVKTPTYRLNGLKDAYKAAGYNVDAFGWDWNVLSTSSPI